MKKNKRNKFNSLKLFVFFMYNMTYVSYMVGYIDRKVNLSIFAFFLGLCIYQYFYNKRNGLVNKEIKFLSEFKAAMLIVFAFLSISICIQIYHGDFNSYVFNELLYNIIPPVLAFFWINTSNDSKELKPYFYIFFIRALLFFLLKNGSYLTLENIKSISWNDSTSSVFETSLAHDFIFLEIIFLYLKKPKQAFLCVLLCLLSFKRISFIFSLFIFIRYFIFGKGKCGEKTFNSGVSKKLRVITCIAICIMPLLLNWVVSDSGINYFNNRGININTFTTGRINLVRYAKHNMPYFNGYGSSDYFFKTSNNLVYARLGSMHCDLLKIYYEVTILGVIIFTCCLVYIARKKRIIYLMLLYLFIELICSHFLDSLSVWNMFFMFCAYLYSNEDLISKNDSDFKSKLLN